MAIMTFDFGGSAVKYGVWADEKLTNKGKFTTPATWAEMKQNMVDVVSTVTDIEGIAISAPGVVNVEKQVIEGISAIPYIHHFNIFSELERLFGLPVTIENDANCAGMAEIFFGAAKGHQEVAFVIAGTGIGGAVFHQGKIAKGAHLYGGEFGLMILDQGKTFSELGTAVQMAWRYCDRTNVPRGTVEGQEVFERAEAGDTIAQEEVAKFYDYMAQGLFSIQYALDPEIIVVGGGVSAKAGLFEEINARVAEMNALRNLKDFVPKIVPCKYLNDANLVGAVANFEARRNWE
ncbi:ROK family protein [Enterococcus canis]|uniref:ROK family protein n=1 Tax=Enterococcus canis TaxID=214095 RepID=A0A1L8RJY2_9ENTE|nr:ROK family protein [Enterococcus canis]OJG20079.1 ROK family protein [Enterococcus canis]